MHKRAAQMHTGGGFQGPHTAAGELHNHPKNKQGICQWTS
nr:MAG TPA: hypothetical protein [Caudoviricetes sp.]